MFSCKHKKDQSVADLIGFQKDVKRGWSRAKSSWESSGLDTDEFMGM